MQQNDTDYINARFSTHLLLVVKANIEREELEKSSIQH
jgi:hypothetical protein